MRRRWKAKGEVQFGYLTFKMTEYFFPQPSKMPNVNEVIVFLWGKDYNVDTDGNATSPVCTKWTDFWCRSRIDPRLEFEIELVEGTWRIGASSIELKSRIAVLIASQCDAEIFEDQHLARRLSVDDLIESSGHFSFEGARERLAAFGGYPDKSKSNQ